MDTKSDEKSLKILCKTEVGLGTSFFSYFLIWGRILDDFCSQKRSKIEPEPDKNRIEIEVASSNVLEPSWARLGAKNHLNINLSWQGTGSAFMILELAC